MSNSPSAVQTLARAVGDGQGHEQGKDRDQMLVKRSREATREQRQAGGRLLYLSLKAG